jgi:hypothetical protein
MYMSHGGRVPQLHFSVDESTAEALSLRARQAGVSLSQYLAALVRNQLGDRWPDGYIDGIVGSCREVPMEEPDELELRPVTNRAVARGG